MEKELDAILEYDPLKNVKGEANSIAAKAKILKAQKDQETAVVEQKLEEILGEIAAYIGVQKKFSDATNYSDEVKKSLIIVGAKSVKTHTLYGSDKYEYNGREVKLRIVYTKRHGKWEYAIDICYMDWYRNSGRGYEINQYWSWPLRENFFFEKNYKKKKIAVMEGIKERLVRVAAGENE